MDFEPTPEQKAFREQTRLFAEGAIRPAVSGSVAAGADPAGVLRELGRRRLMGVALPEGDGGGGRDNVSYVLALVEVTKACAWTGALMYESNSLYCFSIYAFGNREQKRKYLHPCVSGEGAGSFDLSAGMPFFRASPSQTTAAKAGGGWILNGRHGAVPHGDLCSHCIVTAKVGDGEEMEEPGLFVVNLRNTPGLQFVKAETEPCAREAPEVILQDAVLPENALLERQGEGRSYLDRLIPRGWTGVAARALGIGRSVLREAMDQAKGRGPSGKTASRSQTVQWCLADMAVELDAAELLTLRAAWFDDEGKPFEKEAAMAKIYASDAAMKASIEGIRIVREYGYTREHPLDRHLGHAKTCQVELGTKEMVRGIVAGYLVTGIKGST
ncbi:MAG: acyl-CoA dehydrogenase family protein [Deltaproteobacteria bacterium]|nr:acyl-CoA dehydrogenase family protein [Deltaproteobacteria bacterium]